jgi:hypothetical protein
VFSWLLSREEDLFAEKLEKMFFESLRGLGEAGDCGMLWNAGFGVAKPASGRSGQVGLFGLIGIPAFSLPFFPRMASDKAEDLGIFRNVPLGGCLGCRRLSTVQLKRRCPSGVRSMRQRAVIANTSRCGL